VIQGYSIVAFEERSNKAEFIWLSTLIKKKKWITPGWQFNFSQSRCLSPTAAADDDLQTRSIFSIFFTETEVVFVSITCFVNELFMLFFIFMLSLLPLFLFFLTKEIDAS